MAHPPLNLIWGAIPTAYQFSGVVALPFVVGIAGLTLMAFAVGYGSMARRIRHRGGIYSFITHGLGPAVGVGSSFVAILSYTALLASLIMLACGSTIGLAANLFGVRLPMSLCIVVATAAVVALERLRLRALVRVLLAIGLTQAAVIIWVDVASVAKPVGGDVSFHALDPAWLLTGSIGLALGLTMTAFIGSESGASYVDEVRRPERTIPRATLISYAATTVVLVISVWAISVTVGPEDMVAAAQGQLQSQTGGSGHSFVLTVIELLVGSEHALTVTELATAALALGCLASGTMRASGSSRQLSALAGDGVLPAALKPLPDGRSPLSAGCIAPVTAGLLALVIANTGTSIGVLYLITMAGLGIAGVLTLSSLATITWFLRSDDTESGFFGWEGQVVAAGFAAVTTGFVFCYGIYRLPQVVPSGHTWGWTLWAAPMLVFVCGVATVLVLRAGRSPVVARIGR
ncbi:APC family permease [Cryptosporangium aurantiacum]|nr:APC family permease [Cryptosporangium aurantiacum]